MRTSLVLLLALGGLTKCPMPPTTTFPPAPDAGPPSDDGGACVLPPAAVPDPHAIGVRLTGHVDAAGDVLRALGDGGAP